MKYITTFDSVFFALAVLQVIGIYITGRMALDSEKTGTHHRVWLVVFVLGALMSVAGATTFYFFYLVGRVLFVLVALWYCQRKSARDEDEVWEIQTL